MESCTVENLRLKLSLLREEEKRRKKRNDDLRNQVHTMRMQLENLSKQTERARFIKDQYEEYIFGLLLKTDVLHRNRSATRTRRPETQNEVLSGVHVKDIESLDRNIDEFDHLVESKIIHHSPESISPTSSPKKLSVPSPAKRKSVSSNTSKVKDVVKAIPEPPQLSEVPQGDLSQGQCEEKLPEAAAKTSDNSSPIVSEEQHLELESGPIVFESGKESQIPISDFTHGTDEEPRFTSSPRIPSKNMDSASEKSFFEDDVQVQSCATDAYKKLLGENCQNDITSNTNAPRRKITEIMFKDSDSDSISLTKMDVKESERNDDDDFW